jgi:hypothetical protein
MQSFRPKNYAEGKRYTRDGAMDANRAGVDQRATGSGPLGDTGVTRQALLLDVKEALVDEFVDAERA